ncbi:MAG: sarcosine oxidase subunit gamma family protein [Caulobacteraceae bacterium]|nr:sarcosine oxidase subunit gamma family protein [Caulobacteraceae bacterium]
MGESTALWTLAAPGLAIAERQTPASVLRIRRPDAAVIRALGEAFGLSWPAAPNTVAEGAVRIAWLAPGEWLLFASAEPVGEPVATACEGWLHHLSDVTAGYRLWRIEGPRSRDLLAKGAALDTHPRVFRSGQCAQTLFAKVHALVIPDRSGDAFDLLTDVSFAGHVRAWFIDAAEEFRA